MQTLLKTSFHALPAASLVMFQMMKGFEWQDEIVFQRHKKNDFFFLSEASIDNYEVTASVILPHQIKCSCDQSMPSYCSSPSV